MRFDNIGLFWEDIPAAKGKSNVVRPIAPIPDTGWTPPTYLPDLSAAKMICIDLETYDPELIENGPGWARGVGHIVGVAIGTETGRKWYFPIRHEMEPGMNWDPEVVLKWCRQELGRPHQPKLGANITYDYGWFLQEGVEVKGPLLDVQYAEALLDETASVELETLGQKYLDEGKKSNVFYKWAADSYGGKANGRQRANIYRSPPRLVGPYAESDADLPTRVFAKQLPLLQRDGLIEIFDLECRLIRCLVEMRFAGVSVDIEKAERTREALMVKEQMAQQQLDKYAGFQVNTNSSEHLARAFDTYKIPYPKTAKGNPSFKGAFLDKVNHPMGDLIRTVKKYAKARSTFVEGYILDKHINGKLYGQFHQLRGDSGGTRSGRFSSSGPNLQNLPSRDPELGPMIRGLFVPDYGHVAWRKYDYSQIEYRFLAHFCIGTGSDKIRQIFIANPYADFHTATQELIKNTTGIELPRKNTKNINFGLCYGMGVSTLSEGLGLTKAEGNKLFEAYHLGAPFVKATFDACVSQALTDGTITTILGRKSRFDYWEPAGFQKGAPALPYHKALATYGSIKRAASHKGLNRLLQGSAADQMKKAMVDCYEQGVFAETGIPRLTVHDELDFSDPGGKSEAFKEMKRIMETTITLRIPVVADGEIGPDWGNVRDLEEGE